MWCTPLFELPMSHYEVLDGGEQPGSREQDGKNTREPGEEYLIYRAEEKF